MSGLFLGLQGRIRGNGHWDPQIQGNRRELGWQAKTIQGLDGKWYSYEALGPIGDLLAASVDLLDNFDSISTTAFEKMNYKLAFILGSSLTDKSLMSQMEPVSDILSGNPAAAKRWATQLANSWIPFAGFRRDLSKLISPMKREYDNEIQDLMRNRNNFLDIIDPDGSLPFKYNFVTGKEIGKPENLWSRFNNAWNPIKVHEDISPEEEFLLDIEYDSRPVFNQSSGGVKYDKYQRADLYSKVGEQGYFNSELKKIIRFANNLSYTNKEGETFKGYEAIVKGMRRGNISSDIFNHEDYASIFLRLDMALSEAKKTAEHALKDTERFADIYIEEIKSKDRKQTLKSGDIDKALTLEDKYNQLQQQLQSR